jgi:CO dehydrogenase nickel-insertion accessory protein CooC1
MKIGIVGKGGAGKTTLISLLAEGYTFEAYDADPLGGLREVLPPAKRYEGIAVEPALIEFPLMEKGFRFLARDPEVKIVLVTTPHHHAVRTSMGVLETLERYCPNEVLGVVVNQSSREKAEEVAERLGLELLGSLPLHVGLDDHLVENETLAGYRPPRRVVRAIARVAENLGLEMKAGKKARKGWRLFKRR